MNRLTPEAMQVASGRMIPPPVKLPDRRWLLLLQVLLIHVVCILGPLGWSRYQNWKNPPALNAFRVKIGGNELSHAPIVGKPERIRPGGNPRPVTSDPTPEPATPVIPVKPIPEPAPPPPVVKPVAEPKTPVIAPEPIVKPVARPKVTKPVKPNPAPKTPKKPAVKPVSNTGKTQPKTPSKPVKPVKPASRDDGVYRPAGDNQPIGGGGTNTNMAVPIGKRDVGQAYGKQDNRPPGGGAKEEFDRSYGENVGKYLDYRWAAPPGSAIGNAEPEVLLELSIAADGRVMSARIVKASGVPAMDESIRDMLAKLDRVPTPPNGAVIFQIVMQRKQR